MLGIWRMRNRKLAIVTRESASGQRWRGALLLPVAWSAGGMFNQGRPGSAYDLFEQVAAFDDFLPVCDLLEEQGFDEVARFLRALAEEGAGEGSGDETSPP